MKKENFERYLKNNFTLEIGEINKASNEIITGKIITQKKNLKNGRIINSIPRFCSKDNYTKNWGMQWNIHRSTQLDSHNGLNITFNRFWNNTKWKPKELYGKTVLEVGSGAGRFTEILLEAGCEF